MSGTTQPPMLNRRPVVLLGKVTTPSVEEPDFLANALGESDIPATGLGQPATTLNRELTTPPTPTETEEKVKAALPHEIPSWMEIHPSHLVTPVGQVPPNLGKVRWHHRNHRSSKRRAQHHCTEEQRRSGRGTQAQLHHVSLPCLIPLW